MQKSESIKEIAIALNKVQARLIVASKDGVNTFFKNPQGKYHTYATLASIMEAVQKPFVEFGLSYIQASRVTESGGLILETVLMHTSGEWIVGEYPVKAQKDDPQGLAAAMTYARRNSLSAICGTIQEDDDAESAMQRDRQVVSKPSATFGNMK